jgi:hypothetical protein
MKNNDPSILFLSTFFFLFSLSIVSAQGNWKNILKDYQFTDLVFADDHVWISTDSVGLELYCYGSDFYSSINMGDGLPSNHVNAIEKNEENKIWIATDEGVAFSDGKIWTILNVENSNLFSNDVKDIQITNSGEIWMGFDHAIQSFDPQDDTWKLFDASNVSFFPDSTFINMEVDGDDIVWAAFPHNLIKFSEPIEKYTLPPRYLMSNLSSNVTVYDTIYSEIRFISKDSDGKIRVVNGYDSDINETTKTISFHFARDIGGIIHEISNCDYWWGGGNRISNITFCNNPFEVNYYINDDMSIGGLRKAPLRFSPSKILWIIHGKGISILDADNSIACKEKEIPSLDVLVFPNPSNGFIHLNIKNEFFRSSNLTVYNSVGQLFFEKEIFENTCELDLSHLKKGIYFLKFTDDDWTHVEKISMF